MAAAAKTAGNAGAHRGPTCIVAQRGAREHYLAARALHRLGLLEQLVVDWYAGTGMAGVIASLLPAKLRKRAWGARSGDLPESRIRALNFLGLSLKARDAWGARTGRNYAAYLATDSGFARAVAALDLPAHEAIFGYAYASLEIFEAGHNQSRCKILDQIDPGEFEHRIVEEERVRWPGFEAAAQPVPERYWQRNRAEWQRADCIVVNSAWTRDALISQGVAPQKIEIIPLAYERAAEPPANRSKSRGARLQVLWLGTVCLRKGIQYLIAAAEALRHEPVDITVAGPIQISPEAVSDSPANLRWLGQIPRSESLQLYQHADVFVLPTLSDGFAITQLEALAHGVPVVTTPNCGQVVTEGETGFIIPPRDPDALAEAVMKFVRTPTLSMQMVARCTDAARKFTIDAYAARLEAVLQRCVDRRQ